MIRTVPPLLLLLLLTGCSERLVRVLPYEREYLAKEIMTYAPMEARSEQQDHVFMIRESARGAQGGFQGGCGCR